MGEGEGASWALGREDMQVLFSVLPGGASLYLGFMAHEGNLLSLFLQKMLSFTPHFFLWKSCAGAVGFWHRSAVAKNLLRMRKMNTSLFGGDLRTLYFTFRNVFRFCWASAVGLCLGMAQGCAQQCCHHRNGDDIQAAVPAACWPPRSPPESLEEAHRQAKDTRHCIIVPTVVF